MSLHYHNSFVASVYRQIMQDVINNVSGDFEDLGIDEAILQELQTSWEQKLTQARPVNFPSQQQSEIPSAYGYYDDQGNFIQPSTRIVHQGYDHLGRPVMVDLNRQPGSAFSSAFNGVSAAALAGLAQQRFRQPQYSIMPSILASRSILRNGMLPEPASAEETAEGAARSLADLNSTSSTKQIDAAIESHLERLAPLTLSGILGKRELDEETRKSIVERTLNSAERLEQEQRERERHEYERNERKRRRRDNARPFDDPEDEINSDLDDTEDEQERAQDVQEDGNIILCLYDKVTRTKNKWKCSLKDGVMTLNGRDFLFHKANGDFDW